MSRMIGGAPVRVLYKRASVTDSDFHYEEIDPPGALAGHVRCLWRLRAPATGGAPPEPIVPDGCVEIVLNLADPFVRHTGNGASHRQPLRLLAGQITRAVTIAPSGRADLWGIRFHPWSAAAFLKLHGTELRDRMMPLADASRSLDSALDRVVDAGTEDGRRRALFDVLAAHARSIRPADPVLPSLVARIAAQREAMSVRELARAAGLGTRRVQAMFAERVGMSPKMLMRITRFQRAMRIARERADLPWSVVAVEAGYYDQPHLNHDSREIAGCAPSALVSKDPGLTEVFLADGS
jgi:AraC-like DNA-binding protein